MIVSALAVEICSVESKTQVMATRKKTATEMTVQPTNEDTSDTSVAGTANKKPARRKSANAKAPKDRYIDLRTDFGFKHIFGDREFLLYFLNAVLKIEGGIVDLHYDNTEKPGLFKGDRTTIFDLYCKTKAGESILIEMQNARQECYGKSCPKRFVPASSSGCSSRPR